MQGQFDDVSDRKCLLWQVREKEFVNNACTCDANGTLLFARGMGRYHHTACDALGAYRHAWTIIEAAHHLAFRALLGLVGGQMQACLDEWMIQHSVVFAAGHESEACQIGEHGS